MSYQKPRKKSKTERGLSQTLGNLSARRPSSIEQALFPPYKNRGVTDAAAAMQGKEPNCAFTGLEISGACG
jgi:hypothetical protein